MDIHEALYTTRTMRRLQPDPIPLDTQAPAWGTPPFAGRDGGNSQRWHFVAVDDPSSYGEFAQLFRQARALNTRSTRRGRGPWSRRRPVRTRPHTLKRCAE